jgi:glycerol uptake operon antiterminator
LIIRPVSSREIEQIYPQWRDVLENRHIIAAIRNIDALAAVVNSPTEVVYLLFGNPLNLGELIKRVRDQGKLPLVNLDLLSGFSRDTVNAEYLAVSGAAGVVSTHGEVLRASHKQGLITVQRTFALDSAAIEAGVRTIHQFMPDAVEILPAVAAPRVIARFREVHPQLRVVAGGLIADLKEVEGLLAKGVDAVSISDRKFWV